MTEKKYSALDLIYEVNKNKKKKYAPIRILDVGCTGSPTFLLTINNNIMDGLHINLYGIDKNLYLDTANPLIQLAKKQNIEIQESSIEEFSKNLPDKDNFDIIFINAPTPGSVISLIKNSLKILKEDGKIFITHAKTDENEQTTIIREEYSFNRILPSVGNKWNPKEELIDQSCYMGSLIYGNIYELTKQSVKGR